MATVRAYLTALGTTRNQVAALFGTDIAQLPKEIRASSNANLVCIALVVKALTDKGVITPADLQAAQAAVLADVWTQEPSLP